ncbi:serine/threonine-protein kinase SAPK2 [Fagus crenata]
MGGTVAKQLGSEGASLELDQVAVAIALVLEVEDLGVAGGGRQDESGVEELEDSIVNVGKIGLDLGSVVVDQGDVVLVAVSLHLLLDGGDDGPRGSAVRYLQI